MKKRLLPPLLALFLGWTPGLHAGPWTPEPGHGYLKIWAKWLPGIGWFPGVEQQEEGVASPTFYGAYHEFFLGTYAEVGMLPGLALVFHDEPVRLFLLEDPHTGRVSSHASLGDPALGAKVRVAQKGSFVASLEGRVRAPVASDEPVQIVYSLEEGNPAIGALRVGSGVWDLSAVASLGWGFPRFYLACAAGAMARTGGFDTVLLWEAEAGTSLGKTGRWLGRIKLNGHHPLGDGSAPYHQSPSGIGNGTRYVGFALELNYKLKGPWMLDFSLQGGLGPVARQTGGPVLTMGVAAVF